MTLKVRLSWEVYRLEQSAPTAFDQSIWKMGKVACFQATALDAHVVVVVGSECLSSILKYGWGGAKNLLCKIRQTSIPFLIFMLFSLENSIWAERERLEFTSGIEVFDVVAHVFAFFIEIGLAARVLFQGSPVVPHSGDFFLNWNWFNKRKISWKSESDFSCSWNSFFWEWNLAFQVNILFTLWDSLWNSISFY